MVRIPAVYRDGKFEPTVEVDLRDDTPVELLLVDDETIAPHPDENVRAAARHRAVESMKRRRLPLNIPNFTRDELHEGR